MRTLSILVSLVFISSCSYFIPGPPKFDYSEDYVTGKHTETFSSEKIKKNLTRKESMAGGNYQIEAFPITQAYINSISSEIAAGKVLTKKQAAKLKNTLSKKFLIDTACVEAVITVKEFQKVNSFKEWRVTLIDSNNIAYKLDWLVDSDFGAIPGPIMSVRHSYHGKEKFWTLIGKACATADLKMQEGFTLVFRPSFVQWPFNDEVKVEWSFNHTKIVDGKEIKVEKKKRKKEGYRGW